MKIRRFTALLSFIVLCFIYIVLHITIISHAANNNVDNQSEVTSNDSHYTKTASSTSNYITLPNINALKHTNLVAGCYVQTKGYKVEGDEGAAKYYIDNKFQSEVTDIKLCNGLFAHLIYDSVVNVASLGIYPGSECSAKLNDAMAFFENKIDYLQFNNGMYNISNQIWLRTLPLKGATDTNFFTNYDFNPDATRIFVTDLRKTTTPYSIDLENINFYYITSTKHTLKDNEIILMSLRNIAKCTINNCKFIAQNTSSDRSFMKCDLLWFQETSNSNITITNCDFENNTARDINVQPGQKLVGGCLWFTGNDYNSTLNNVLISDCNFTSTCSDEIMAMWRLKANNININNCLFFLATNYSNNLITLCKGAFNNTFFNNCTFYTRGSAECFIKFREFISDSNINFNECKFNNSCMNDLIETNSVFYIPDFSSYLSSNKKIVIDNCEFTGTYSSVHRPKYILNITGGSNYNYVLNNSTITMPLKVALVSSQESKNCSVTTTESSINTSSKLTNVTNVANINISYSGNTIYSDFTNQFNQTATTSLSFNDNICKSPGTIAVDNCPATSLQKSDVSQTNNTFESSYSIMKKLR